MEKSSLFMAAIILAIFSFVFETSLAQNSNQKGRAKNYLKTKETVTTPDESSKKTDEADFKKIKQETQDAIQQLQDAEKDKSITMPSLLECISAAIEELDKIKEYQNFNDFIKNSLSISLKIQNTKKSLSSEEFNSLLPRGQAKPAKKQAYDIIDRMINFFVMLDYKYLPPSYNDEEGNGIG